MSDATKYPPQQGYAWRGQWEQRLRSILSERGFSSVMEFATAHPIRSFVQLADELGSGDVAAVQIEWSYLDEAKRAGSVEDCARDLLVRVLHEFLHGWPRADDLQGRDKLANGLAAWSSRISSHLREYGGQAKRMAFALLNERAPEGWLPASATDPVLIEMFRKHWR